MAMAHHDTGSPSGKRKGRSQWPRPRSAELGRLTLLVVPCALTVIVTFVFILNLISIRFIALIRALRADTLGNLVYRNAGRNFNAVMATAARVTIVQVEEVVEVGVLDPDLIVTPGIFVKRLVVIPAVPHG